MKLKADDIVGLEHKDVSELIAAKIDYVETSKYIPTPQHVEGKFVEIRVFEPRKISEREMDASLLIAFGWNEYDRYICLSAFSVL